MIHIVDYGAGNLFSVKNALDYLQIENKITADPADLKESDGIILPGVGAFRDAMTMLNKSGFAEAIKEQAAAGKPLQRKAPDLLSLHRHARGCGTRGTAGSKAHDPRNMGIRNRQHPRRVPELRPQSAENVRIPARRVHLCGKEDTA